MNNSGEDGLNKDCTISISKMPHKTLEAMHVVAVEDTSSFGALAVMVVRNAEAFNLSHLPRTVDNLNRNLSPFKR